MARSDCFFIRTCPCESECWWRVDPYQPRFLPSGVFPPVRSRTFKVEAVARFQMVMFFAVQRNVELPPKDVQEFLAFVRVGFAAAPTGFDAEKVRLHHRVSPGKQLHAHIRSGFEDFS